MTSTRDIRRARQLLEWAATGRATPTARIRGTAADFLRARALITGSELDTSSGGADASPPPLRAPLFARDALLGQVNRNLFTLMKGKTGDGVASATKRVQQALLQLGYLLPRFGADGSYGNETMDAVSAFQQDNALKLDGRVGPQTLRTLDTRLVEPPHAPASTPSGKQPVPIGTGVPAPFARALKNKGFVIERQGGPNIPADASISGQEPPAAGKNELVAGNAFQYGHTGDCAQVFLEGKLWPGHYLAAVFVASAINALGHTNQMNVAQALRHSFGKEATQFTLALANRYHQIWHALHGKYTYHCTHGGAALSDCPSGGPFASTPDNDTHLCIDRIGDYTPAGMATLIIHETIHRIGFRGDMTHVKDEHGGDLRLYRVHSTNECDPDVSLAERRTQDVILNADSYGCFAEWANANGF